MNGSPGCDGDLSDILATDSHRREDRSYDLLEEMKKLHDLLGAEEFERPTSVNPGKVVEDGGLIIRKTQLEETLQEKRVKKFRLREVAKRFFKRQR